MIVYNVMMYKDVNEIFHDIITCGRLMQPITRNQMPNSCKMHPDPDPPFTP